MRRSLINRRAVSHTIGFILVFTISVILMTSTILVFNSLVENKNAESAEKIALEIANRVSDAIVEAISTIRSMENTNYTKIVELPSMGNMNYYVELSNGTVYVNTTDGKISVKKKVYNVDKLGFPLEGKVYGSAGRLKITANSTRKFLSLDFGTASSFEEGNEDGDIDDYSPVEPGYVRVTNLTKIFHGSGGYWPKKLYDTTQITFLYRVPIIIDNTNYSYENETGETVYIESENLSDYPVAVTIPADFPYHLVDKTSDGKPRLVFWEINVTGHIDDEIDNGEICPYWIESWNDDPPGVSTVWVKLHNVRNNSKELIYMCFGAINSSTEELIDDGKFETIFGSESQPEYQPENFFLYFEDFDIDDYGTTPSWKVATFPSSLSSFLGISENRNYSFYKIYTGAKKPLTFIRLPCPSVLLCGKPDQLSYQDLMKAPGDPDDPTPGNYTQNSTHYILEARVRFHGTDAIRGEIVTNINVTGLQPDKKNVEWFGGGVYNGTPILLSDGKTKWVENIKNDNIMTYKLTEDLTHSEKETIQVKSSRNLGNNWKWYAIITSTKTLVCTGNLSVCRLNTTTNSWEWVLANNLNAGDKVCTWNATSRRLEWATVIKVNSFTGLEEAYSIVSPYGNFIADGFLVHSCFMFGGTTISTPPSPSYRMDLGYDIAGRESVPKLALYKNDQSGNAELFGGDYSFQADHSIEKDTWYVMYTSIINSKVNDWRNNSWKKSIKWNYTLLESWLFEQRLGGKLATYTPTGVDTSLDGENDPTGEPYLSARNLAIACGFVDTLNSHPAPGSPSFDIDWIRVRKSSKVPPRVSVGAVEAYMVGWADTDGIEAHDRLSKSNALYRDFNNATDKKTFCLYLKGGNYTITIHLGDADGGPSSSTAGSTAFNHTIYIYHNNSGNFEKIAGPIKILQSDHTMDRVTFVISIPDDGNYHYFNLTFSAVKLDGDGNEIGSQDPNAPSWVVNGIDIEVGDRTVRMGYV